METVGSNDHGRPRRAPRTPHARDVPRVVSNETGDALTLTKREARLPSQGIDQHGVEGRATDAEPPGLSTCRPRGEGGICRGASSRMRVGHPVQASRSRAQNVVEKLQPPKHVHARWQETLTAGLVPREPGSIEHGHPMARTSEQQRRRRAARPGPDDGNVRALHSLMMRRRAG